MPNYKRAITNDDKFVKYSLNEDHQAGKHKAKVYKKVLGYDSHNYSSLKNQIHNSVTSGKATLISIRKNQYDVIEYKYIIDVTGPNGNTAKVVAIYGINKKSSRPYMITNYVK